MDFIDRTALLNFKKNYAIIIGIDDYDRAIGKLMTPVQDAKGLRQVLNTYQGYHEKDIWLLENPTKDSFSKELQEITEQIKAQGNASVSSLLFYFAGHGLAGDIDGVGAAGYFLPTDADTSTAVLSTNTTLISMQWVFDQLAAIGCHHNLLILDCCFAGAFRRISMSRGNSGLSGSLSKRRFQRYRDNAAFQVLASAGPAEKAADFLSDRGNEVQKVSLVTGKFHSPFAKALIDALSGKVEVEVKPKGKNLGDGVLTSHELFIYLHEEVERLTRADENFNPQNPDLFPLGKDHKGGQFIFVDPSHAKNLPDWAELKYTNPYLGLAQYDLTDHPYYFGREEDVKLISEKMGWSKSNETVAPDTNLPSLMIVTGASGTGKSSLVKAGILPHYLEQQYQLFQIRAGLKPVELMVYDREKEKWKAVESFERLIEADQETVLTEPVERRNNLSYREKQILLIDQYDEVFNSFSAEARASFERLLIQFFKDSLKADANLKLILTLRSDFEWHLQNSDFGQFYLAQDRSRMYLHRLKELGLEELRKVLLGPTELLAYQFEKQRNGSRNVRYDLVNQILEDLDYFPTALPLLSCTMQELVKHTNKAKREISFKTYQQEVRGVAGVFKRKAEEIYARILTEGQSQAGPMRDMYQKVFLRLVQIKEGTYSRRSVQFHLELRYKKKDDNELVRRILQVMEQGQLVSFAGQPENRSEEESSEEMLTRDYLASSVQLIHDSLILNWNEGRQWIKNFGKENMMLQEQLWIAASEWYVTQAEVNQDDSLEGIQDQNATIETQTTLLWDNNPRLQQVIYQIIDPHEQLLKVENSHLLEAAYLIWNKDVKGENREKIIPLLSWFRTENEQQEAFHAILEKEEEIDIKDLLEELLLYSDHWLNAIEEDFIKASWTNRHDRIAQLHRRITTAEIGTIVANARAKPRLQILEALNLLKGAWERLLREKMEPLPVLQRALAAVFYEQFGGGEFGHCQPLPQLLDHPAIKLPESIRFDQAGTYYVFQADDDFIHVVDRTGTLQNTLKGRLIELLIAVDCLLVADEQGHLSIVSIATGENTQSLAAGKYDIVCFSPLKTHLITYSEQGKSFLWNDRGEKIARLSRKTNRVHFSSDGQFIICFEKEGNTGKVIDLEGQLVGNLEEDFDDQLLPLAADYVKRGKRLAINWGPYILLYTLNNGQFEVASHALSASLDVRAVVVDAVSPFGVRTGPPAVTSLYFGEGAKFLWALYSSGLARCWNVSGELILANDDIQVLDGISHSHALSEPGQTKRVDTASILVLYDPPTGNRVPIGVRTDVHQLFRRSVALRILDAGGPTDFIVNEHHAKLIQLEVSSSTKSILGLYEDGLLKVWDKDSSQLTSVLSLPNDPIKKAWFFPSPSPRIPKSEQILTLNDSGRSFLWPIRAHGRLLANIPLHGMGDIDIKGAGFIFPGQRLLVYGKEIQAQVSDYNGYSEISDLFHITGTPVQNITLAAVNPNGMDCFALSNGSSVQFYGPTREEELTNRYFGTHNQLAICNDARTILALSEHSAWVSDKQQEGLDWDAPKNLFESDMNRVIHAYDPTATLFLLEEVVDGKRQYCCYDRQHEKKMELAYPAGLAEAHFDTNRQLIILDEQLEHIWQLEFVEDSLTEPFVWEKRQGRLSKSRISADGRFLIIGKKHGEVDVLDLHKREVQLSIPAPEFEASQVTAMALEHQSMRFLVGYREGIARLYDVSGNILAELNHHSGAITQLEFEPFYSERMLSVSADGTCKLWPLPERIFRWLQENEPLLALAN